MSSNTPGNFSSKNQMAQESSIASSSTTTSHHNLRKRPCLNVPVTKEATTSSTSSISGHPGTSHSKLRNTSNNASGSMPGGVRSLDLPSSSTAQNSGHVAGSGDLKALTNNDNSAAASVTTSPVSQQSSSYAAVKSTKTSVPKLKYELKNLTDHFPDQVSHEGRLTRSRTRALATVVPIKQPSTSSRPSTSTKSFFVQGKDKIVKKGRDLLKNSEYDAKKKRSSRSEKHDGSSGNDGVSTNSDNAVVVRNSESHSSPVDPGPSIDDSARTTPFSLQQTNSTFAPRRFTIMNPSAASEQHQIPTIDGLPVRRFHESNDSSSFRFYHPSGLFLDGCCKRLELDYQIQAYQFWANISVNQLHQDSIPRLTHTTVSQEMSGFSSLSLLFTGCEAHAGRIRNGLNKYFLQNCTIIGGIVGQNLSQTFNPKVVETLSSDDLTDIHFVTLAHFIECRIVVFKHGAWKRFGKWTDSDAGEYVPIILLESKFGRYSPIFSC